jgi:hypothetical protein
MLAALQAQVQQQGQQGAGQPGGLLAALQVLHQQAQQQQLPAPPLPLHADPAQLLAQALQLNLPQQQQAHLNHVMAAGGAGGGGLIPQGGVMQQAAPLARMGRVLEPHLHFLARLKGLGGSEGLYV